MSANVSEPSTRRLVVNTFVSLDGFGRILAAVPGGLEAGQL
jgi:hypothetical protein